MTKKVRPHKTDHTGRELFSRKPRLEQAESYRFPRQDNVR